MQQAIEFEVRRQIELIEDGGTVVQETRLYDPDRDETRSMRSKEDAQDYRYFPDPDLPPLVIDDAWIERVQRRAARVAGGDEGALRARSTRLPRTTPRALTASRETRRATSRRPRSARGPGGEAASSSRTGCWASSPRRSTRPSSTSRESPVAPAQLAGLLQRIADGTISGKIAKDVFDAMWAGEQAATPTRSSPPTGLKQISDAGAIEKIVDEVLAANPAIVAEFRAGKEKAFNSLVGKAMAATKGKANPAQVNAILKRKLAD